MRYCENCKYRGPGDWVNCPECGAPFVSVATDSLDSMVEAASIPSLSVLFKRAKAKGAIKPQKEYGGAT